MGQPTRGAVARCVVVLAALLVVLGMVGGVALPASASPLVPGAALRVPKRAGPAAAPASLQAAIRKALAAPAPAAGYAQQAELNASGESPGGESGYSVALAARGTTALVGAPDPFSDAGPGAAFVFTLRDGTWSQTAELTNPEGESYDDFGRSVALSARGTTALIGESGHAAAYVFTLRGGTWSQTAKLTAGDKFGYSVALSAPGTTALIGAPFRNSYTGAAFVFTLRGGTWSQTAELTNPEGKPNDLFGYSVALSARGATALIGAVGRSSSTGAAYVFALRGGTWSRSAELTASGGKPNDDFGRSVALSARGTTALIGEFGHISGTGAACLFTLRRGTWSQSAELTASYKRPSDFFGWSVALSARGTTALIGAAGRSDFTGAAYVFTLRRGSWSQTAELTASGKAQFDEFGYSVALSARGTTALIGAPYHNASLGVAYVFAAERPPR
jgi:hypothetical protein